MNAVTSWIKANQAVQINTGATYNWLNLPNILNGNTGSAIGAYIAGADQYSYKTVQLIKGGVQSGTDKGTPTTGAPYGETKTFGGAADMWGNTLTVADIESSTFGVAFEFGLSATGATRSYRVQATDFRFDLPDWATVVGIEFRLTWSTFPGGGGTTGASIDAVEMRINYSYNPRVTASGESQNFAYVKGIVRDEPQKDFAYKVYDSSRNLIGEYLNVRNEPTFRQNVNTLHSNMQLNLAQNETSTAQTVDTLLTEASEILTTEADEDLLIDLTASLGVGPGTNVEVNNEVEVISYYGQYVELLCEDGDVLLTEADELIMIEDGRPDGKKIFTGYISQWELDFGDSNALTANLLSHSKELDNIILETDDTIAMTNGSLGTNSYGIVGAGPTDLTRLAQVFRYTGTTGAQGRIRMRAWPGWAVDIPVSIAIYAGNNPATPGALVAGADSFIKAYPDNFRAPTWIDFYFDPQTLTNGSDYIMYIDTPYNKTGGNPTYPANFYTTTSDVANSALYYYGGGSAGWTNSGSDLYLEVYTLGGNTTRTFNSVDPSNILKQVIDFARSRGARVAYDSSTIENTNTQVSITFKTNTISECIDAILKTAPADWYYYYDYGENMIHFHARPTTPARYYTQGRDVVKLKIKRTIEKLINDVLFTGGGNPALLVRNTDQTRITNYRRGLAKMTDNRVTVQSTAQILSQSDIDQYGDPLYSGELTVIRVKDFRIEEVTVGELSGFINFGSMVDAIRMQNLSITYYPDKLDITLNLLTPPVTKRIEDIKRNLALKEHENDPSAPVIV